MRDNEYLSTEQEAREIVREVTVRLNGQDPFEQLAAASGIDRLESLAALYTPVCWPEAWLAQPEAVEWLFEPVLEKGTVNALFGKPGTGKSLIALEISLSLVRDGHTVVYVDDENRIVDLVERLQAMGASPEELGRLLMYSFAGLPPLDTPRGGENLLALATVNHASLTILDTTSRMVAGEENSADTYLQLYRCSLVPLKGRGITVLRLDHPGKDETRGQRGSSAKDGDVDTIWHLSVVAEGLQYLLRRAKSRSGHSPVEDLEIRRRYEPLRHEWAAREGTPVDKIIGQLAGLGVPTTAGRPTARKALSEAGIKVENSLLEAAIYKRKNCPGQPAGSRAASDQADRCPPVPLIGTGSGQSPVRGTAGDGDHVRTVSHNAPSRLRILDGCCGAGGAARGYADAGHEVIGVDIADRLRDDYLKSGASEFRVQDILEALAGPLADWADFIHVSPPCQRYSRMTNCRPGLAAGYPDLIGPVRDLLNATGKPWVLENVPGAPLHNPVTLCGWMFGHETYRHRLFETGGGFTFTAPEPPAGTAGPRKACGWPHPLPAARAGHWEPGKAVSVSGHERRGPVNKAMAIDWMTRREDVAEAIPPYFTRWIGGQLTRWRSRDHRSPVRGNAGGIDE